jgi:hypothetical protein
MADVAGLWAESFAPGKLIVARGDNRICVSLWDCEAARGWLPSLDEIRRDPDSHRRLMSQVHAVAQPFSTGKWNVLDRELPAGALGGPEVKAIHYTDMAAQPQLRHALPRLSAQGRAHWFDGARAPGKFPAIDALFDELLAEATANGYGPWRYTAEPAYGEYRKASLARAPKAVAEPKAQRRVGQN